ncbi:MAG: hypothetical protein SO253_02450 [Bacilli bacterium]|nr:hypothetical protein [Bacilli bacterium]
MAKNTEKITKSLGEFESVIDVYQRNGYKVKTKNDKEALLVKKTVKKKWRTFNSFILLLPKLVLMCCTLFLIIPLYNYLHSKHEKVTVKLIG